MTLSELSKAVATLGFEKSVDYIDDTARESFLYAASRAVSFVNSIRPITDSFVIDIFEDASGHVKHMQDGNELSPAEIMNYFVYDIGGKVHRLHPPMSVYGTYIAEGIFRIENGTRLLVRKSYRGSMYFTYDVKMPLYTINTDENTKIILDDELCSLLPNLVAYYVLMDDSPEKALEYKRSFNEHYQIVYNNSKKTHTSEIYSSNNW